MWRALALSSELAQRDGDDRRAQDRIDNAERSIKEKAAALPESDLRDDLQALGQQVLSDPVGAHR